MEEFDFRTRARSTDPDTSLEAAEQVVSKIGKIQAEVLLYFMSVYPRAITDLDLQAHFGNQLSTYRTRRRELVDKGLIADTGKRVFQQGRSRALWVWTGKGRT